MSARDVEPCPAGPCRRHFRQRSRARRPRRVAFRPPVRERRWRPRAGLGSDREAAPALVVPTDPHQDGTRSPCTGRTPTRGARGLERSHPRRRRRGRGQQQTPRRRDDRRCSRTDAARWPSGVAVPVEAQATRVAPRPTNASLPAAGRRRPRAERPIRRSRWGQGRDARVATLSPSLTESDRFGAADEQEALLCA